MKTLYFIFIALLGSIGTALTILADHKLKTQEAGYKKNWFHHLVLFVRRTSFKVFVIILTTIGIVFFTFKRDELVDSESEAKQLKKDSITRRGFQQDRAKSDSTIANILADNYIKLDTANKKLTSIMRDSLKREKIDINQITKPQVLFVVSGDTVNKILKLKVVATSHGANTKKIKVFTWISSKEGARINPIYKRDDAFTNVSVLPLMSTQEFEFPVENFSNTELFIFLFEGSYQDLDGNIFPLKLMYGYNPKLKTFSDIKDVYFDRLYQSMLNDRSIIIR